MYSVCLYCSKPLGTNEIVEQFPIGRRLAFDASKGRLWVVCPSCRRWCLTPIEERWEAIEACERLFRDARVRASTPEISLVRLREGLELVRVGAPLRPEMAAWRYGREFAARRRRAIAVGAGALGLGAAGAGLAASTGALSAYLSLIAMGPIAVHLTGLIGFAAYAAVDSARAIPIMHDGKTLRVYRADLSDTHLVPSADEGWGLRLKHSYGRLLLTGDEASRVSSRLLARANGTGAASWLVGASAAQLAEAPTVDAFLCETAGYAGRLAEEHAERKRAYLRAMERNAFTAGKFDESKNAASFTRLAPRTRLALEMALHEESERRALEVEFAPLIAAWREAEEIAGIADTLLVPASVDAKLDAMRASTQRETDQQPR